MKLNSGKNRIICPVIDFDILDMCLDHLEEKRFLGKEQKNYVQRFDENGQKYLNSCMDAFKGRWEFEFFHSEVPVLYHTDSIKGNDGDLGFILPLDWSPQVETAVGPAVPGTIMYKWWSDRRVMYTGNGEVRYTDDNEIALTIEKDSPEVDLVFDWRKDNALIFDCKQLHSARRFENGWKEFVVGFVT
tara:strand:+ start:410 stop:973 length:564 start_codon:yes stop_codon:yes gene_type:complete